MQLVRSDLALVWVKTEEKEGEKKGEKKEKDRERLRGIAIKKTLGRIKGSGKVCGSIRSRVYL